MKLQRAIYYCLLLALVTYGFNYHFGKALVHLATLLSGLNILFAIKNKTYQNISNYKSTYILIALLIISATLTLIYYIIFDNHMSERHFINMFYPTLFFAIIIPSLKVESDDKKSLLVTALISCFIMSGAGIVDYISMNSVYWRTSGFLNLPIIYASCMVLMTSWLGVILFESLAIKKWLATGISFIAVIAAFASVLFTGSRGPIIATVVILVSLTAYYLLTSSSKTAKISSIVCVLIASALLVSFSSQIPIKDRFLTGIKNFSNALGEERRVATSTGIRLDMWEASLVAIGDHPLTGIGPGSHTTYFPILEKEGRININTEILKNFDHMHNDYIQAWLSMGILFGTLSIAFILYFFLLFYLKTKNTKSSLVGLSICSSFILCGITDVPAHNAASLTLFLLIASLQLSYLYSQSKSNNIID